jgi:uncharacterized protein YbjT (DUF2867 family)
MSDQKIITVLGATGAQGGGLVSAILSDPDGGFAARAITRNAQSDKARALAEAGAEVVEATLDDYDSLRAAFDGTHGVFVVTAFWEHFSPEKEMEQVRTAAAAARDAGVHHVIWSTLEDTRRWMSLDDDRMPTLGGKYKVPHFDGKGESDRFWREMNVPTTNLLTSFYWDNFIWFGLHPQRGEDGNLAIVIPMGDKPLPAIAVSDIGKAAYAIFKRGDEFIGKTVGIAGEHLTGAELAAALSGVVGETVHHFSPPWDVYRSFPFDGADDMGNMFQFYHDFNDDFAGARDPQVLRDLVPDALDFQGWLDAYGDQIPRDD